MDTCAKRCNVLSLYSGAGAFDLGFKLANPDARTVCYVEREASSVALLVDHMQKGGLDEAPIWTDSGTFDGKPWCGKVDWVIGGFPCQPASKAGRRAGTDDDRWLWPHIRRIVFETRPQGVFLENVRGLLSVNGGRAYKEILRDLAGLGYDVAWGLQEAAQFGAPHQRARVFILAHTRYDAGCSQPKFKCNNKTQIIKVVRSLADVADWPPPLSDLGSWRQLLSIPGVPTPVYEPEVRRVVDGVAQGLDRADKLRILGNGVVPQQAAEAFRQLFSRLV